MKQKFLFDTTKTYKSDIHDNFINLIVRADQPVQEKI